MTDVPDGNTTTIIAVTISGLIGAALTTFMPWLMQRQKNKIDAEIRKEDRDARKEVADLAAEAVRAVNARSAIIDDIASKTNEIKIHVNSNLTEAIQGQHDFAAAQLVTLLELQDIKRTQGKEPTAESIALIEVTRAKLSDLRKKLEDRAVSTRMAEAEQKRQENVTTSDKLRATEVDKPVEVKVVESINDPISVTTKKEEL